VILQKNELGVKFAYQYALFEVTNDFVYINLQIDPAHRVLHRAITL